MAKYIKKKTEVDAFQWFKGKSHPDVILLDKEIKIGELIFCADKDTIRRVWDEVNDLSDAITQGYVSLPDLRRVLDLEYDIVLRRQVTTK